ncbi:MAG TPA: hypothetical protein VFE33_08245 [Thermoanaerobaculia bacterium]|nr:hypothetical protein [Thermoanaerobaculia bacterium]
MKRSGLSAPMALFTALAVLWMPLAAEAQTPPVCQTTGPRVDNRDGYFVNLEEGPVAPLALTAGGAELWAVNLPDASVTVFSTAVPTNLTVLANVKVALGPVAVASRPSAVPEEMWVVCQSSNSVVIVDRASRRVLDSIRLKSEPSGIVFNSTGSKAWISLSASNQIAEINTATRTVATNLDFGTPFPSPTSAVVHVEEPRSLLLDGTNLYALSFESGNGTMPALGTILTDLIFNLWSFYNPAATPIIPPPPDRDVLRFQVPGPSAASEALWRTGSINFDLKKNNNTGELWVSNVDHNNTLVGEFQFGTNNPIARHRLTHALPLAAGTPAPLTPPASLDLNSGALPGLLSQGYACSMPNQMAFAASFQTLYVGCYETHNVAVVDLSGATPTVVAELRGLTTFSSTRHQNFGVRGLVLHPNQNVVYTYSRDNRVQVYSVPVASGSVNAPVQTVSIGFDVTPALAREGRFVAINSLRAQNKVQSCNTCHVDGHLDRIAWDLSDFTGDLSLASPLGRVPKGTKTTLSLRGIEETPPFHWRGDRADLAFFNPAFQGLLGGTQLSPTEMSQFEAFVFSLSYPANPNQQENRALSSNPPPLPNAVQGEFAFRCLTAHTVSFDTNTPATTQAISCQFCHGMAGGSGTNHQINNDITGLLADDATQLRGLFDKESDIVNYASLYPPPPPPPTPPASPFQVYPLDKVPATGWGFGNTGSFADTVADFVNLGVFQTAQLTQTDRNNIVAFLSELDTGMPPAAAYAWTLNPASAATPVATHPFTTLLQGQASPVNTANIDLILRGWMFVGGVARNIGMKYNPATAVFDTDTTGVGPFAYTTLVATAAAGRGVFLLVGTPRGSGYRLGLDSDMDFALDGNEPAAGAVVGIADTDGDGFPDGYEMRLGSNPANPLSLPPPSTTPPLFAVAPAIAWKSAGIAKLRWQTKNEGTSRIEVRIAGAAPGSLPLVVKEDLQFKKEHVLVVRGIPPGQSYDVYVKSTDPAAPGNTSTFIFNNVAIQGLDFQSVHIAQTVVTPVTIACGSKAKLMASFTLVDQSGNPVPGATVTFTEVEWVPGAGSGNSILPAPVTSGPSNALGIATAGPFVTSLNACAGAVSEVFATAVTDPTTNLLYFHPLDGQTGFWGQLPF